MRQRGLGEHLRRAWPWVLLIVAAGAAGVAWWQAWQTKPLPPDSVQAPPENDWQAAVAECRRRVDANPEDVAARLELSALIYQAGDPFEAAAQMEAAVRIAPDEATVRRNAGNFYAHLGNMALAVEHLAAAVRLSPDDLKTQVALANAHRARTENAASEAAMAKAVELAGESAEAHLLLGRTFHAWSDPDRAEEEFDRALELAPNSPEANFERGRLALEGHDLDGAQRWLQIAVGLSPESGRYRYYLGLVFVRRPPEPENLATAREHLERALELLGPHAGVFYGLGTVCEREGDTERAAGYYEQSVAIAPDYSDALHSLVGAYRKLGRTEESERAMAGFRELKEIEQEITRAEARTAHEPDSAEAHYQLALAYEKQGSLVSTLAHLQKAKELDPEHPAAEKFSQLYGKVGAAPHLVPQQ
ncbi:MAG: tetratricopeptide repeat protein [Armatimonadota bacterium]